MSADYMKCTIEEFKTMVATCTKAILMGEDDNVIEASFKCVGLHYLNFEGSDLDVLVAQSYFRYASNKYLDYTIERDLHGN